MGKGADWASEAVIPKEDFRTGVNFTVRIKETWEGQENDSGGREN